MSRFALVTALSLVAAGTVAQAANLGVCRFDPQTLVFKGSPTDQARCLLRPVAKWGRVSATPATLPPTLARIIGTSADLPKAKLNAYLVSRSLPSPQLNAPVSRAHGGSPSGPGARYFVIHDTSSPWLGDTPFPGDLNTSAGVNDLSRYRGPNAVAHMFVARTGAVAVGHDFAVPWRATKLENRTGVAAKGLFLHIENVQPRRRDPGGGPQNDAIAPQPGLTDQQYDRLAQLYALASARAGVWLIPGFHAAIDEGLADAHDDPQNFELNKFDGAVRKLLEEVEGRP